MLDQFRNTRDHYSARLVSYLAWLILAVSLTLLVLALFTPWLTTATYLFPLVIVSFLSLYLLMQKRLTLAALLLVGSMWLVTTFITILRGIYSPASYAYLVIILLAGAVFNERAVLITSVLSALGTLVAGMLTAGTIQLPGIFPVINKGVVNPTVVLVDAFGILANMAFFALLTYLTVRQTRLAFQDVERHRRLLNEQNQVLEDVNSQLVHEIEERAHYEEALQASELRFRELFEQAPIMYVLTKPNEEDVPIIVDCNQLFLTTLAYETRTDIIDQPLTNFYTPHSVEQLIDQGGYAQAMESQVVEGERELLTAVGESVPVWLRALPQHDDHGRVIGTRAMFVDISLLKKAQHQAEAYNQQLATMHRLHVDMTRTLDLNQVAQTLLHSLQKELDADFASLFLIEEHFRALAEAHDYQHWQNPDRGLLVMVDPRESPIFSQIVADKTSLIIPDTAVHPHWIQVEKATEVRSFMAVPLLVDDEVVAFCGLDKNEPHYFTDEHLRLVESVAGQAAMALENTRLHENLRRQADSLEQSVIKRTAELQSANQRLWSEVEERRRMQTKLVIQNQQLGVLRQIGLDLASELELSQLLEMIVTSAMGLLAADGGRLYLVHEDPENREKDYLLSRFSAGPTNVPTELRVRRGASISGRVWETQAPVIVHDYTSWEYKIPINNASYFLSVIGVPISSQDKVLGVILMAAFEDHYFSQEDVTLLELFAAHAAVAIRNAQLHEQVQQYADELEQRVRTRTQDLITANLKLRELDELKSKFINDMSHELRTPVATLGLYLDLLERRPDNLPTYLETLQSQFDRLSLLVQQVVEMSELDLQLDSLEPRPLELAPLLTQVVTRYQPSADARGLTFEYEFDPDTAGQMIWGDPNRLEQLLSQLLDNALKYTPAGSIHLSTQYDPAHHTVTITIADTGLGIPEQDLPHIFESFYRGHNVSQLTKPGTGLGLTTAKAIAEIHGGRIAVESNLNEGTTVRLRLPLAPPNTTQNNNPTREES